jgi:iron-sulfur cluster repair protein YtfE (RIC family)
MMTTTSTLADLATTHPAASRVFKRYGLDFCCGGRTPLAEVCSAKGLNAERVLQEIAEEERTVDLPRWDTAPLPALRMGIQSRPLCRKRIGRRRAKNSQRYVNYFPQSGAAINAAAPIPE